MPADKPALAMRDIASFQAAYAPPDEAMATSLLTGAGRSTEAEARIDARATHLVQAIRARVGGLGGVEDFLHAYALSTKEGLALMVLAEALLRVPDADTADRLIEDKLKAGDWAHHDGRSASLLVSASAWTLGITARVIHPGETPEGIVETLIKRLGLPAVRAATRQAMWLLGSHFVLGENIAAALARASSHREYLYSFDMLGEGARSAVDAERYLESYAEASAARRYACCADMDARGAVRFRFDADRALPPGGTYVAPAIVEFDRARELKSEIFGPVLHVVRGKAVEFDQLIDDIAATGYALTLGIHSRIDATVAHIVARLPHGNVYVNRNMIGAVVGSQPFGGSGLSGTGPKAGGPNYLHRFALEQVVTVNTAASGGNATLLSEEE